MKDKYAKANGKFYKHAIKKSKQSSATILLITVFLVLLYDNSLINFHLLKEFLKLLVVDVIVRVQSIQTGKSPHTTRKYQGRMTQDGKVEDLQHFTHLFKANVE